ncbi:hypothetical protein BC940DRAFT_311946 [Gongronella butleri]|nr:hypothetical protein BC940DRAFT_311946 [Gongronella butleri]
MSNPFLATNVATLQEAFPAIDKRIIERTLHEERGDMNETFDRLLALSSNMTSNSRCASQPAFTSQPSLPPLPSRPSMPVGQQSTSTRPPMARQQRSFREEMDAWRQEIAEDRNRRKHSKKRGNCSSRRNDYYTDDTRNNNTYSRSKPSLIGDFQRLCLDGYTVREAVQEGQVVAKKAASSLCDRVMAHANDMNSTYGLASSNNPFRPSTASTSTLPYVPPSMRAPLPPMPSSGSRPVPPRPVIYQPASTNPFTSATPSAPTLAPNEDIALPPPAYESREFDRLIDPVEGDRYLVHAAAATH